MLSSQHELVDNVKICDPLGKSGHNKTQSESTNKNIQEKLPQRDWNNMLMNKTAIEC